MTASDPKADLHRYLQDAREALLWKLDGLSEYDIRRPLVPTGTNLLGLVKHVASVELGYFGDCFGRPFDEPLPWLEVGAEPNADMWADGRRVARADRRPVPPGVGALGRHHRRARAGRDRPCAMVAGQDRSEVTLHQILIHMIAETHRHAGHADIVRELIDGCRRACAKANGAGKGCEGPPPADEAWVGEGRRGAGSSSRPRRGRPEDVPPAWTPAGSPAGIPANRPAGTAAKAGRTAERPGPSGESRKWAR